MIASPSTLRADRTRILRTSFSGSFPLMITAGQSSRLPGDSIMKANHADIVESSAYWIEARNEDATSLYWDMSEDPRLYLNRIASERARIERPTSYARTVLANPHTWPGGYAVFGVTGDGCLLCPRCIRDNWREVCSATRRPEYCDDQWQVIGWQHTGAFDPDPFESCAHCGKLVSAF